MKRLLYTLIALLGSLGVMAQTNQPLPPGSVPLSNILYLAPDSTVWTGDEFNGLFVKVAKWNSVDSLFKLGYDKAQVDSAILSQIGLINFPVTSVNGEGGDVMLDAADVGLGNVDNTSDANKPVSIAQQAALDGKEDAFSKGSLVAGTGVSLMGTLTNRLVGSGDITINSTASLTAANGIDINSGVISPVYGTSAGTIAQGDDSRINNGQTAFDWGNHANAGYWNIYAPPRYNILTNMDDAVRGQFELNFTATNNGGHLSFLTINQYDNSDNDLLQLGLPFRNNTNFGFRTKGATGAWSSWRSVWHSGNFTPPTVFSTSSNGLVPSAPSSGNLFLRRDGAWVDPQAGGGGGTNTDLSITNRTSTTLQINSSTGTAATVPARTASLAGLMTPTDLSNLNSALQSEVDPTVGSHIKAITTTNISNWNSVWSKMGQYLLTSAGNTTEIGTYVDQVGTSNTIDNQRTTVNYGTTASGYPSNGHLLSMRINSNYAAQLHAGIDAGSTWSIRNLNAGTWTPWRQIWHSGNFNPSNYLTTSYVPTWASISGKPATFTPSPHSHNANDINAGTLAIARLPSTVAYRNATNSFTGANSFTQPVVVPNGTASNHAVNLGQLNAVTGSYVRTIQAAYYIVTSGGSGLYLKSNSVSDTDYECVIPGYQSGSPGMLEIEFSGYYQNTSGSGRQMLLEFSQGANTYTKVLSTSPTNDPSVNYFSTKINGALTPSNTMRLGFMQFGSTTGSLFTDSDITPSSINWSLPVTLKFRVNSKSGYNFNVSPIVVKVGKGEGY